MKRRFQGLASTSQANTEVPDGVFLVRVDQVRYSRERQKPFYTVRFSVIEPVPLAECMFSGRLYCRPKALWKFSWFLRDFGYDSELLGRDEVEEKNLIGLRGVVKLSHTVVNGHTMVNLDAFAPAGAWESISSPVPPPLPSELAS
ncbi:MAG: hypothetical protein ACHP78_13915 [Terriglobales bacterium]